MRIPIRTSRWAIWARRIASIALPIEVIPVFMHRERVIASDAFTILFGIGLALAALAIIVSLIAFARLWQSGFRGWSRTLQAFVLGGILLAPAGVGMTWAVTYPPTNDVATNGPLPALTMVTTPSDTGCRRPKRCAPFPPLLPGPINCRLTACSTWLSGVSSPTGSGRRASHGVSLLRPPIPAASMLWR